MRIHIEKQEQIARDAAQKYVELLNRKPEAVLGYATGSTPLGLYFELARLNREGALSFARATTFNLDEYAGLDGTHPQSYRYFMNKNLFYNIDIPIENTHVPSGINTDIAAKYDEAIEAAGGIDLQLLGIGNNGHIGFNEPGTPFGSVTHVVDLTDSTRQANARFFESIDEVPTQAVSMGIKTVMNAKSILMICIGKAKAQTVRDFILGEVTPDVPASILQLHPDVDVYLDPDAASLL